MMGYKYFLSLGFIGDAGDLASKYVLLVLCASITSNLALSAVSERGGSPSIILWIFYTVAFTSIIFSMVTAWTLGNGFLQQLQSVTIDEAVCLSVHLTSGITAFVGCYLLKSRLGRYHPIPIK
jgi:ammonia channel protein AmtB